MAQYATFIAFFAFLIHCNAVERVDISEFQAQTESVDKIPTSVPNGIYTISMENNIIPNELFYRFNDGDAKWIAKNNWTFTGSFTVPDSVLGHDNINLVFDGLDTFADITLNDQPLGQSENMFVRYSFNVKDVLKSENNLQVNFVSALEKADELYKIQEQTYQIPRECPPDEYRGDCHVNMIRKMQASFSWDWGPSLPSIGIWKPVYVEAYNETLVRDIVVNVDMDDDSWYLYIDTYFENNTKDKVEGVLTLDVAGVSKEEAVSEESDEYGDIVFNSVIKVNKTDVNAWWPRDILNSQDLYNLTASFSSDSNSEEHSKTIRIGFRKIELVQDKIDSGLTFYFKVNGIPMFMKGSNWIPADILPEKGEDKEVVKNLLSAARDANMNMLRVWGGGVYESDYFYDLADEYGILIWQDFMFACSLYPSNEDFLSNVATEVRQQIKRLTSHASVAIYAGNNENESVLSDNWYGVLNKTIYTEDYIKLYVGLIKAEINRLTHNRSNYVTSSPSNGDETISEGYLAKNVQSVYYGDVHFYNYDNNPLDSNSYPTPRFSSEYGFQAYPSLKSFSQITNTTDDLELTSEFMDYHQHQPGGNQYIKNFITMNLELPNEDSPNYENAFLFYSQVIQAMAIKTETEHYRNYMSILTESGEGRTMGALYWQLNDVWVAPTWSSIDYYGNWKMLHFFAKRFFSPVIITGEVDTNGNLNIFIVSDLLVPLPNVTARIQLYNWGSLDMVNEVAPTTDLAAGASVLLTTINVDNLLNSKDAADYFFYLRLEQEGDAFATAPDNFVLLAKLKDSNLSSPNLKVAVRKPTDKNWFIIEVTTDNIALFVWLDSGNVRGHFTDNGFLQVEKAVYVIFSSDDVTSVEELTDAITVTHLLDEKYL